MVKLIKKCSACQRYTLKAICPICQQLTYHAIPPKFSPEDRYGAYRRILKSEGLKSRDERNTN